MAALGNLKKLYLEHDAGIQPSQLREFAWLPNLESLQFGNETITDAGLLEGFRGIKFPNLELLAIGRCNSDGTGVAAFAGAPLVSLRLASLSDAGAAVVGQFKDLETLTVNEPKISGTGLTHLAKLSKLRELKLQNLKTLSDEDFTTLETMTGLYRVELEGSGAGDKTAKAISKHLIRHLTIGSPDFTDEGMKHIGTMASLNSGIRIGAEAKVTDAGIRHFWAPKWIRNITIMCPGGITGSSFETLSNLTNLVRVEIRSRDLTDVGLRYLGYLPKLQHAYFGGHGGNGAKVTDKGLLYLAEAPKLRVVKFSREGCPVTDAGIEAFKQKRPDVLVQFGW